MKLTIKIGDEVPTNIPESEVADGVIFKDIDEFAEHFVDKYNEISDSSEDDDFSIAVIAKFDVMINILNYLIKTTNCRLGCACIIPEEDTDVDAYFMEVDSNGDIFCEGIFDAKECVGTNEDATYVHLEANSKFVTLDKKKKYILFDIENCEFEDEDEDECDYLGFLDFLDSICPVEALGYLDDEYEYDNDNTITFSIQKSDGDKQKTSCFTCSKDIGDGLLEGILKILNI